MTSLRTNIREMLNLYGQLRLIDHCVASTCRYGHPQRLIAVQLILQPHGRGLTHPASHSSFVLLHLLISITIIFLPKELTRNGLRESANSFHAPSLSHTHTCMLVVQPAGANDICAASPPSPLLDLSDSKSFHIWFSFTLWQELSGDSKKSDSRAARRSLKGRKFSKTHTQRGPPKVSRFDSSGWGGGV